MSKKILFVLTDKISETEEGMGGLASRYHALFPSIIKEFGKENIAICQYAKPNTYLGVKTYQVIQNHLTDNPFENNIQDTACLSVAFEDFKPDIVLVTDQFLLYPVFQLCTVRGIPYILDINLIFFSYFKEIKKQIDPTKLNVSYQKIIFVENTCILPAYAVIGCSDFYKDEVIKFGHKNAYSCQNTLNLDSYKEESNFKLKGNAKYNILYLGRISAQKGIRVFLDKNFKLPKDTALHIMGGRDASSNYDVYKTMFEKKGYHFYGGVYGADKNAAIKQATMGIMPSIHEPYGIVADEFFYFKTPIITSSFPGIKEHSINSAIVETNIDNLPEAAEQYSKEIAKLLSMSDEGLNMKVNIEYDALMERQRLNENKFVHILKNILSEL